MIIGAFVIGAIMLGIAGIVVFGAGRFFTKTYKNVLFFEGSVQGLQTGAPVVFRGVKIGQVTDIIVRVNPGDLTILIPVYIETYPKKIMQTGGGQHFVDPGELQAWIRKGLRAQLHMQSFVTGQLMVNLDFFPTTPVRLVGLDKRYYEIPTIPSGLEQLTRTVEELPLKEMADRLNETIAGIDRLVNSRELQASIGSLNQLLKNSDMLVKTLSTEIRHTASDIRGTTDAARATFVQAEKTLRFDEGQPGQVAASIKETLSAANATLKETHAAVSNLNGIAVANSNLGYEIGRTLEQIGELSRSIRVLADYLERHPEALLRGKSPAEGE